MSRVRALMRGYSLLEVLISLVILSIGLLALAGMQLVSMRSSTGSYLRTQAAATAQDIQERIFVNPKTPNNYELTNPATVPAAPGTNCATADCTTKQLADWDLYNWYTNSAKLLPSFRTTITCSPAPCPTSSTGSATMTVTVMWDEPDGTEATGTGCNVAVSTDRYCYRLSFDL